MNTEVMFSSKTDLWETPQEFFDELDKEFHFTLDVCAMPENAKCKKFYTPDQDGLKQAWKGVCWCNPPYGREIGSWVRRAWLASAVGNTVVMLLPSRTDTLWFHDYIYNKERVEVRFVKGRLKFGGCKNSAPFPSMVVVFRKNAPVIEDVAPVVHSKWVLSAIDEYIDENGDTIYGFHYYCENCGVEIYETDENIASNYCFNCGAKMDGGTT